MPSLVGETAAQFSWVECVSRMHRFGRRGKRDGGEFFFGRGVILGRLVSGSPMMWVTGVEQVLQRHNQPLDGESGLPTMETRFWHPLSSPNVCRRWRALGLDPSWQLHCSHNSLMVPLAGSHPPRLSQTFIIEIGLLICFPSAFSSRFLQKTYSHIHGCTCHGRVFI